MQHLPDCRTNGVGAIRRRRDVSERRYAWEYIFVESKAFAHQHGAISESNRQRLYFDLAQGNGDPIVGTGGLKRIRCGPGGHRGTSTEAWEAVFAEYQYPDIQKRVYMLIDKCPMTLRGHLNDEEKQELRQFKVRLDDLVGRYYEGLQEEDESSD
jgi:hypothetical protein